MKMFAMAGLVFAADVVAVLLIVFSLRLENWLGLQRDVVVDFVFIAAICYGAAGWILGKLFMMDWPKLRNRIIDWHPIHAHRTHHPNGSH